MLNRTNGIIQSQAAGGSTPVQVWVYITYSSSSGLDYDVFLDASQDVDGIAEGLAWLESYYPAESMGLGDLGVVLDMNLIYMQYEVQQE